MAQQKRYQHNPPHGYETPRVGLGNVDKSITLTNVVEENSNPIDFASVAFDSQAPELIRTWSSFASWIVCLNAYPNGITLSIHPGEGTEVRGGKKSGESSDTKGSEGVHYLTSQFHLRLKETKDYLLPHGRYFLFKDDFAQALEKRLAQLREQQVIGSTVVYFGTVTDPFASFHKKFNVTMTCLEILEQYQPGLLVLQTRSPMVISALPTLKALGSKVVVGMPVESRLDSVIARYTPGQPKIADRLIAVDGLRCQGIPVNLMASPILPYGDVSRDAWDFAELLENHADFITFGCLACGKPADEAQLRALPISQQLVADKQYRWLRPHAYRNLYYALKVVAPEKLLLPVKVRGTPSQLSLFAAA